MQLLKYLLLWFISLIMLSNCSILNSKKDIIKMAPLPKVINQFNPQILWQNSVGEGIGSFYSNLHPAWENGTVYTADRFGIVKALDAVTGKEKWRNNLSSPTTSLRGMSALLSGGITVHSGYLYIGSERGQLYVLNTSNGKIAWQIKLSSEIISNPIVSEGQILLHTNNGMLYGLNKDNGKINWCIDLGTPNLSLRGESSPIVAFEGAIVGDGNGNINVVLITNGQLIWRTNISKLGATNEVENIKDVIVTPIIVDDIIYALAYNGNLVAINLHSGEILWNREIGGTKNLVFHAGRIYVVDQHDHLIALDANNYGMTIWNKSDLLGRNLTPPVLFKKYLVVGDSKGYIHWVDPMNGKLIAQKKCDTSGFYTKPIIGDNKLFIQSKSGKIYAINI